MMKKGIKLIKIILTITLLVNILAINNTKSYAKRDHFETMVQDEEKEGGSKENSGELSGSGMSDVSQNPGLWTPSTSEDSTSFDDKVGIIASLVRTIGIIISVGTLLLIGIKFMLGSVEEKAQYKQTMVPWIIGAIMIFAMTYIPTFLYNMSKGMFE